MESSKVNSGYYKNVPPILYHDKNLIYRLNNEYVSYIIGKSILDINDTIKIHDKNTILDFMKENNEKK